MRPIKGQPTKRSVIDLMGVTMNGKTQSTPTKHPVIDLMSESTPTVGLKPLLPTIMSSLYCPLFKFERNTMKSIENIGKIVEVLIDVEETLFCAQYRTMDY